MAARSKRDRFRDPDITSLVESHGGEAEPRDLIRAEAQNLIAHFRQFTFTDSHPFERMKILASLQGFSVAPMAVNFQNQRDAVVVRNPNGRGGQIFFNPLRPDNRVLFSVAHEIVHGFFPITGSGIRFRELTADEPPERNELERLCDLGAAELVMPTDEFQEVVGENWTIRNIPKLMSRFGASFEATLYRLASAHPGAAVAGLLRYRRTKPDELKLKLLDSGQQKLLFGKDLVEAVTVPEPKYRRQSLHLSVGCNSTYMIPWNKSFDQSSRVYRTEIDRIASGIETLPTRSAQKGHLEAVDAPYQRADTDPNRPDILFYWREL